MKRKAYPNYKPSCVEWLGEVPEHWEMWKVAHGFDLIGSGTTPPSDELEWYDGTILWVTTSELRENEIFSTEKSVTKEAAQHFSALKVFPQGSLAIAMYGATIGRLGIFGIEAATNQACCVMYGGEVFAIRFVYYWMQAFKESIILLASGGGQPNISQDKIKSLKIPCPAIEEQQSIAAYLDRETNRIDSLIAKKQRLLSLLAERRTALISRAVTKGLNANAKMKPSGVEWLGEVPEHWELWKIAHGFDLIGSGTTPPTDELEWYDGTIPWVTTSELRENEIFSTEKSVTKQAVQNFSALKIFPQGSLAIAMYGATIGRLGIFGIEATTNQACCVMHGGEVFAIRFVYYWMQAFKDSIILLASGGGQPNISQDKIKSIKISCPTIMEQQAIAAYLDRETAKIDALSAKVETIIERLKEYRTALISEAVTGKIDLREAV